MPTHLAINTIHQGDCIAGLKCLPDACVDLAFADPPFNIGYEYDVYKDNRDYEEYRDWSLRWMKQVCRVLKVDGTFWLAIGDEFAAELKLLAQNNLKLTCRSWVIWYYTFGVHCTKKFTRSHAHLFHFVKDPKRFTFNEDEVRVPSARQLVYADARANPRGRMPDDTWILRPQDLPHGFKVEENTWYFPRVAGTFKERSGFHGCQMPEQLLARIIKACSNQNDVILDPFAGSATSLVVAKKLGRRPIGFELSPEYVARGQERLDRVQVGQLLEGAPEPLFSAPATPSRAKPSMAAEFATGTRQVVGRQEIDRAITEAFLCAREGFPVDRVIADPELNERFVGLCRRFGLPGRPFDWNHRLMNLRKRGSFMGLPHSRRTTFGADEVDRCTFACEIAIQSLREQGISLDHALCDPDIARMLDHEVRTMLRDLPSLKIRWIVLNLRKRAQDFRHAGQAVRQGIPLPRKATTVADLDFGDVPVSPGLYWLEANDKLYVGDTVNLRSRLEVQLAPSDFDFWGQKHQMCVRYAEVGRHELRGHRSVWIGKWNPKGNCRQFGAAPQRLRGRGRVGPDQQES